MLDKKFFERDCLAVAPDLVGKVLVRKLGDDELRLRITETEAYRGEEDTACHAHKGKTERTSVLYMDAGTVYVYLCYGIHFLLNIVTERENVPQAVLIRACENADGPGKLTKRLLIDRSFNKQRIYDNDLLYIEDDGRRYEILKDKRVGIDYASEHDRNLLWRFKAGSEILTINS